MKKLAVAILAATAMAISSQAATIAWGSSGNVYFQTTKMSLNTATAYLCVLSGSSWSGSDIANALADSSSTVAGTKTSGSLGSISSSSGNLIVTAGNQIGSTGKNFTDGSTYFGVMFITTQGGTEYYNMSAPILANAANTGTGNGQYSTGLTTYYMIPAVTSGTPIGSVQGTWEAVPEPCTMALFGIGIAVLGLRRKFRK